MKKTVGQHMYEARQKSGLTAYELAKRANLYANTIYSWETDKALPTLLNVASAATVLGLSINEYCGIPIPERKNSD